MGWSLLSNGNLLDAVESGGFDVLLTVDQNIAFQQKLEGRSIALVIIKRENNRLESLLAIG
jgi:hypothetical protein